MTVEHALPVLAHPLVRQDQLPVSSLFVGTAAACVLVGFAYAFAVRARRSGGIDEVAPSEAGDAGTVPTGFARVPFAIGRLAGVLLLVLAIAVGRFGPDDQLSNLAPALVVGFGWPFLVAASAVLGLVWWWIDPFDTLARLVAPLGAGDGAAGEPHESRWWAAVPAAGLWVAYLTVWPNSLSPRTISNALLVYTLAMLAGCLAFGRRTWLPRVEIFGIFLGWVARARRPSTARLPGPAATVVLGVLSGGLVYGLVRDSRLLITFSYGSLLELTLVVAAFSAAAALLATRAERRQLARTGSRAVALAMVPATAALAVALGLARNRFTTSLQLLPSQLYELLGLRPDAFANPMVNPRPLGHEGLLALQILVLLMGHVAGAALAARVTARGATSPAPLLMILPTLSVLAVLLSISAAAVAAT